MFLLVVLCALFYNSADSYSTYDQRQNGDMNVQIDLKNLQIIALMKGGKEDYVDYDYAYDYSEMTIKPTNGTTPKPLNATNTVTIGTDNVNNLASASSEMLTDTIIKTTNPEQTVTEPYLSQVNRDETSRGQNKTDQSNTTGEAHSTQPTEISLEQSDVADQAQNLTTTVKTIVETNPTVTTDRNIAVENSTLDPNLANNITGAHTTKCRRGFVQNGEGKCEYKIHGTTNALRRIVKLAQKIKIGRNYKETSEDST